MAQDFEEEGGNEETQGYQAFTRGQLNKAVGYGNLAVSALVAGAIALTISLGGIHPHRRDNVIAASPPPPPAPVRVIPKADSGIPAQKAKPLPKNQAPPPPVDDRIVIPADHSKALSRAQTQAVMVEAGWPVSQLGTGVAVATAESGRIPNRRGTSTTIGVDLGLFQINSYYHKDALAEIDWRDPVQNAKLALKIWREGGWHPWHAYRSWMANAAVPDPSAMSRGAVVQK